LKVLTSRRTVTILLAAALFGSLVSLGASWRLPGDNRGYEPPQPLAYSHRLHAGELQIACLYCHSGAERSRYAGIPAMSVCMNCHRQVTATRAHVDQAAAAAKADNQPAGRVVSSELRKLYDALALDDTLVPVKGRAATPIAWVRVHNLPDFVRFDHSAHVVSGVACQTCHGPIETMERVRQEASLSMGWCVNCHRDVNEHGLDGRRVYASVDCTTCHY
jgi:hypothetical protein